MWRDNPVSLLRHVALVEGISFLLLLFVAMPLKYFANIPEAVRAVGVAHGVLFIVLCVALVYVKAVVAWPVARAALVFAAALLPFGPFVVDRRMKGYEDEYRRRAHG
jgi:integral membrane protein